CTFSVVYQSTKFYILLLYNSFSHLKILNLDRQCNEFPGVFLLFFFLQKNYKQCFLLSVSLRLLIDEITSIRKSSVGETLADLEYYPISPSPVWNSEDELELLVNDCQERLEQLRENTDETGKLNDETLIR
ncbi:unnamed protein product, partial [Trichobilharzia regenti]